MHKGLVKKFSEYAEEAERAFPQKLKNFVLICDKNTTPIYASAAIAENLSQSVNEVKQLIQKVKRDLDRSNAIGLAYRFHYTAGFNIALIGLRDKPRGFFTKKYTQNMLKSYVLEHEIGHRVVPQGFASGHIGECAADAYACLRHIQIYGSKTDFFKQIKKASTIVLGNSPIHYTQSIFDAVSQLAEQTDVSKLTLKETAELADTIASQHHIRPTELLQIRKAFSPAHELYRKKIGDKVAITDKLFEEDADAYTLFCTETFKVIQQNPQNAAVVKAGKEFLQSQSVATFILKKAKQDKSWQAMAEFIKPPKTTRKRVQKQTL